MWTLWRPVFHVAKDQSELMAEMVESGVHAILVKVACLGLVPEKHPGRRSRCPVLENLHSRFMCTFAARRGIRDPNVDRPLFVLGRIVVDEAAVEPTRRARPGIRGAGVSVERKLDGGGGDGSGEIGVGRW